MSARSGMTNPILKLRQLTNAGSADYSLAGLTFWSDDQLQAVLDQHRIDIYRLPLAEQSITVPSGSVRYYDYYFPADDYEQGTAQFVIRNSLGTALGTADYSSINYEAGHVSFGTVDQMGTAYYLTARSFDVASAAAQVWRSKAASVASSYNFSVDGHSMERSQMVKHYQEMANLYSGQAKVMSATMERGDNCS